jgi:hypothetical protein
VGRILDPYENYLRNLPDTWTINEILDHLADVGVIVEAGVLRMFCRDREIKYQKRPGGWKR